MKKILLSLGTVAAITTPIVGVVSCGSGGLTHANSKNALGHYESSPEEKKIEGLLNGEASALESWTMSAEEVVNKITTTKTEGLLDLDLFGNNSESSKFGGENVKSQLVSPDKPIFTKTFTKKEVISEEKNSDTGTIFEEIAKQIKDKISDKTKNYAMTIKTLIQDDVDNNGEYKISIFEKKPSNVLGKALANIKDETKFKFDSEAMAKLHGTYVFGQHHAFSGNDITGNEYHIKTSSSPIEEYFTKTVGAKFFNDRIKESHFYSWTMLKPQTKEGLDGAKIQDAIYVFDKKTQKYNLRLELSKADQTSTVYLKNDWIYNFKLPDNIKDMDESDWMVNKFDDEKFKTIWEDEFSFSKIFAFFNKVKAQASSLKGMAPLKDLIIDASSTVTTLAGTNSEIKTPEFYNQFLAFLKNKYDQNSLDHLMVGIQDYKIYNEAKMYSNYIPAIGAKGYNGLIWGRNLLDTYVEFVNDMIENKGFVPTKISSVVELQKNIDEEK